MGFKLVEAVYRLDRDATTPTEQAVLLALAFRANDKTLLCYPKQGTIAEMTHLSRSTVAAALNVLRQKGMLDWKSGGYKNRRGKYGQPLSNDYRLNLVIGGKNGKIKDVDGIVDNDVAVSSSRTRQCPALGHSSVQLPDTAVSGSRTPTEYTIENTTPIPNRGESGSGFDLGLEKALKSMGAAIQAGKGGKERPDGNSPILMAMRLCGFAPGTDAYRDNYRSFSSAMLKLGMEGSMEVVRTFASEIRQGEMDGVRNLAALLMARLMRKLGTA